VDEPEDDGSAHKSFAEVDGGRRDLVD